MVATTQQGDARARFRKNKPVLKRHTFLVENCLETISAIDEKFFRFFGVSKESISVFLTGEKQRGESTAAYYSANLLYAV
jgi:hypothetical protein